MPEHNGVRIALISQYDILFIPEYHSPNNDANQANTRAIDIYIANYAASHFWIRYACDATTLETGTRFFYFKLYIGGKFAVAWGCGAQDEWQGETFFVPSEAASTDDSKACREKLGMFFPRDVEVAPEVLTFEIRVYRAKARKRQARQYTSAAMVKSGDGGVQLEPIDVVRSRDPRRFYTYALSDPTDEPYACFRYHFRELHDLKSRGFVKRCFTIERLTRRASDASLVRDSYGLDRPSSNVADGSEEEDTSRLPTDALGV